MLKSLKDQVRTVRYSIRAEAEAPGSTLPRVLHDLKPVMAMGGPALRLADGLFTEVGTLANGLLVPFQGGGAFPAPLPDYLHGKADFPGQLYAAYKAMLASRGIRATLISERAMDQAGERFRARQADRSPRERPMSMDEVIQASAALIHALVEARPIRKVTFGAVEQNATNLMLSPNLFCAIVAGISIGLVTLKPDLAEDRQAVLDSAGSVADVRFHRFNRALTSKTPEMNIARELDVLLPFLP